MDADGSNARKLPIPDTDRVDDWSRDGKWFAAVRHPGSQLYVMRPDGREQRRLTKEGANGWSPQFSPDGRRIAYVRQMGKEGSSIWIVDVDGKNNRKIMAAEDRVWPNFACWSPDGKRLAVMRFKWQRDERDSYSWPIRKMPITTSRSWTRPAKIAAAWTLPAPRSFGSGTQTGAEGCAGGGFGLLAKIEAPHLLHVLLKPPNGETH